MDAPGTPKRRTFASFVLSQGWDSAIQLTLDTNPYYSCNNLRQDPAANAKGNVVEAADPRAKGGGGGLLARIRRALKEHCFSSSKTRLAVQGLTAAYLLYVALHPSRNVAVRVTYDKNALATDSSSRSLNGSHHGGLDTEGTSSCVLRAIRRVLRPLIFTDRAASSLDYAALNARSQEPLWLYQSREGMQLLVKKPLNSAETAAHMLMGCSLLPLSLLQMESVFFMSHSLERRRAQEALRAAEERTKEKTPEETVRKENAAALGKVKGARKAHGIIGVTTVGMMVGMLGAGFALRSRSLFAGVRRSSPFASVVVDFSRAILYFSLPWGVFSVGLIASAASGKAIPHAILGSLIPKACLAVALARSLGGFLQRLLGVHVHLPSASTTAAALREPLEVVQSLPGELERMYYISIATAAVVVGAWAIRDVAALLTKAHQVFEEQEAKNKSD